MWTQRSKRVRYAAWAAMVFLGRASLAHAADGVIEINQLRALAGCVAPSDTPASSVAIDNWGGYRLPRNVAVPGSDPTDLRVTADNVLPDLNSSAILGPPVCSGFPPACTATGRGIGVISSNMRQTTVAEGILAGMGFHLTTVDAEPWVEAAKAMRHGGIRNTAVGPAIVTGSAASQNTALPPREPFPAPRSDPNDLSAYRVYTTGPVTIDGISRGESWTNTSGRTLKIRKIYAWIGTDRGARADLRLYVRRGSDLTWLVFNDWDAYADPVAPNTGVYVNFAPDYVLLAPGDTLLFSRYAASLIPGIWRADFAVTIWLVSRLMAFAGACERFRSP